MESSKISGDIEKVFLHIHRGECSLRHIQEVEQLVAHGIYRYKKEFDAWKVRQFLAAK